MAKSKEPFDEGDRGEWKTDLKFSIQKSKIMASSPITSWQTEGEKCENSDRFYFIRLQNYQRQWLQSWNKRFLLLGRKAMTNLDSVLKSRDIILLTKVHMVKAMVVFVCLFVCLFFCGFSTEASILQCLAFFPVQLSHPYMTTGKTIALTRWIWLDLVN